MPVWQAPPEYGETATIIPGIKWFRFPLPFVLNHVNIWLIADGDGWTCIDTGVTWDKGKNLWKDILETYTLTRQIVTHCHPDHVGLSGWLEQQTGAPLWMTQGEYLTALDKRGNAMKTGCPVLLKTYRQMREGDLIEIGGHHWEVITGFGHAYEHAAFYCKDLNILISGDMLLPSISTNVPVSAAFPQGNPLKDFLDSLQKFRRLPENTLVLPSHGRPFIGINERVDFLEVHHKNRCDLVLELCKTPQTACNIMPPLFERDITDAHQCQFAMGESIAHLNYLEQQGLIRWTEKDGIRCYQRV